MEQIAFFKLTTGEELISKVRIGETDGQQTIELNFPTLSFEGIDGTYRLKPWLFIEENVNKDSWLQINPLSVMVMGTPVKELVDIYKDLYDKVLSPIIKPTEGETLVYSQDGTN